MPLPECFACEFNAAGHPCRSRDGAFDFDKAGRAIVTIGRCYHAETGGVIDEASRAANDWVSSCESEVIENHPDLLVQLIIAAVDACETPQDAAFVAAGLIENSVCARGPEVIDAIEALARESSKFRYILSGIWGEPSTDPEVWKRIGVVVGLGPRMSADGRGPWDGKPVTVLDEEDAQALMASPVRPVAA
jgi:hypothetical protein